MVFRIARVVGSLSSKPNLGLNIKYGDGQAARVECRSGTQQRQQI